MDAGRADRRTPARNSTAPASGRAPHAATRFSVIVPAFNDAEATVQTLQALERQDPPEGVEIEIIVADDGSTDDIVGAIRGAHPSVTVMRQDNQGPSAARNLGASRATGDYLLFVDSGDIPLDNWIATFAGLVAKANVGVAGCGARKIDGLSGEIREVVPHAEVLKVGGTLAVRHDLFEQIGGYDSALRFGENTDMMLRAVEQARSNGARIVSEDVVAIDLSFGHSSASYDEKRLDAMVHLLERDSDDLRRDPKLRASYHSIAVVNAARCEQWSIARRHAVRAWGAEPTNLRHPARLALSMIPPLARRQWTADRNRFGRTGRRR